MVAPSTQCLRGFLPRFANPDPGAGCQIDLVPPSPSNGGRSLVLSTAMDVHFAPLKYPITFLPHAVFVVITFRARTYKPLFL